MKMKAKRFLSLILCVLLTLTLLPPLTARADGPAEQYTNLTPGTTYYFDLSNMNIPGESDWLPDKTLHWTPFTYAGTINAYYSDSFGIRQAGDVNITAHSLFVADAPVCRASFGSLDANGLMFNKTYTKNDINAVLRAPSGGSFVASGSTTPESNEYDQIINKNSDYYKAISIHDFLTQDSYFHPEDPGTTYVMCRGGLSGTRYDLTTSSANEYRPVIQLNDADPAYVMACALDLDGLGTFGTKSDITQVSVVYNIIPRFIMPGFTPENGIDLYPGVDSSKLRWYINGEAYSPGDSCLPGKIMAAGCPFEAGYALGEEGLQLAKPQNLRWDAAAPHLAKWDVVPNAQTYDLQMYKNGVPLGSLITGISVASYNLASAITNECAEHGGGAFTFMVRAVGDGTDYTVGNYSSQSLQAPNVLYGISPVTVSPAHGSQRTIAGLGLPATVNLLTSRGSVAAAVTWNAGCIPEYDIHDVNGRTFSVDGAFSVPEDVLNPSSISGVVATVNVKPALSPGDVYYFDMTGQFPRLSAYGGRYSSFLYVGDINAYSLASEDDTPDNAAAYDHRLFLGSCNGPSLNGYSSWNTYNDFGLIFGKPYTSGGVNYKIRAMSAGDGVTEKPDEYGAIMGTGYFNNPTDPIYSFPNIAHIGSWAQEAIEGGRAYMSYGNREHVAAEEYKTRVLMPVLEVPAEIDAADFKTVVCNGKKILYTGERATLPTIDPDTDDTVEAWRTTDGSVHYPAGAMVTLPSGTALTSVASYDFGTENQLTEGETYYFDLSAQSIPHCEGVATLKWTPFVYAGSITAYSKSDATATYPAPGDPFYSSSAGGNELDFPELNEYYWYITYGQYPEFPGTPANGLIKKEATSPRTLFVAPTLAHALWRELNLQNLIFGKPYTSNNAAYTLRTLSGGSYGLDPRYLERENITEVYRKVVPSTNEISVLLQKGTDEGSPYKYLQTIRAGGAFTLPERYYEDFKSTMRYHVHYRIFEGGAIINTANPPQDNTGSVKFLPALQAHSKSLRSVTYNIPEGIGAVSAVEGAKHSLAVAYEGSVTLPEPTAGNGFALMPGVNSADLRWFDGTDYYQPGVTLSGLPTGAALTLRYAPGTAGDLETPENPVWDGANPHLAKWDAVENAENYDIQLYKNGVPLGSVISVPAAQTQYDFSAVTADEYAANGGGSYTFSVRARDGAAYTTSAYSTSGAAPNVLRGVPQISAVTTHGSPKTAAGLRLPSVTLSTDGGNVTAPVVWDMDAIPYNPANPDDRVGDKTYTVPGMITLPETVKNPIGIPLGLTAPVTVTALVPGDSYFFDMSGYSLPNPSWTWSNNWIPFVYTGTINAYSLSSEEEAASVTAASPAATEHELFVAQCAAYGNCSWSNLNDQGLVFGKPYASGGINYNLRLMSVSGGNGLGGRKDDEWSQLCLKGLKGFFVKEMVTWGQDTAASNPDHRLIGIFNPNVVRSADKSAIQYQLGSRLYCPVLQLPALPHSAYKIMTYDMDGKGYLGDDSMVS
nr:hypothetical protein [Clostridia bacterium]